MHLFPPQQWNLQVVFVGVGRRPLSFLGLFYEVTCSPEPQTNPELRWQVTPGSAAASGASLRAGDAAPGPGSNGGGTLSVLNLKRIQGLNRRGLFAVATSDLPHVCVTRASRMNLGALAGHIPPPGRSSTQRCHSNEAKGRVLACFS